MSTIKSYTDLEQSRKLAEILPIESADMKYKEYTSELDYSSKHCDIPSIGHPFSKDIPCWSLAALLDVLPYGYSSILTKSFDGKDYYCKIDGETFETDADNPVDACVAMIEKLNELKML